MALIRWKPFREMDSLLHLTLPKDEAEKTKVVKVNIS